MNNNREKMISQRKLAGFLLINGCSLNNVVKDKKDLRRDVYFFDNNAKLNEVMSRYMEVKDILYKLTVK